MVKLICIWTFLFGLSAQANSAPPYVFAHYMVCFATYGPTLEGYMRDISEAQQAGIDGFALNIGAWSGPETMYKARTQLIYDAAKKIAPNFKLFPSIEITNTADIVDIISRYSSHSNALRHENKLVVSTYGQNNVNWRDSILEPLKSRGITVMFVPHFWCEPVQELPAYQDGVNLIRKYRDILDGLFYFGAAGLPPALAQSNSNYTRAAFESAKVSMASVTPHYWGCTQTSVGRRYFDNDGYEGLSIQWESILHNHPNWVEIVTWNDWNESTYISPITNPEQYLDELRRIQRYTHSGYLVFSRPYIDAFKSGTPPTFKDEAVFYTYRTHPLKATATDSTDSRVTWLIGDVQDVLYTTVILTNRAELIINSGGVLTTNQLQSGISHIKTPFHAGAQAFIVIRSGARLITTEGPLIADRIERYNFFPVAGCAYAREQPSASGKLRNSDSVFSQ